MAQAYIEKFRKYANAFEMAIQDEDTEEAFGGWTDVIRQDEDLFKMVTKMVDNKDNDEGRKMAVLLCKHKKESVRYLADKVMKREAIEIVDRTNITL